jgi:hypothetical protein
VFGILRWCHELQLFEQFIDPANARLDLPSRIARPVLVAFFSCRSPLSGLSVAFSYKLRPKELLVIVRQNVVPNETAKFDAAINKPTLRSTDGARRIDETCCCSPAPSGHQIAATVVGGWIDRRPNG